MNKLHLGVTPPNEGARRLAWWIGHMLFGDVDAAARAFGTTAAMVERLIAGTIRPGGELAAPIGFATDGFIAGKDWQHAPEGGWFDEPAVRPSIADLMRRAA